MENIKDWCVSRQLWWGHRIPAWYFGEGEDDFVVAKTLEDALKAASKKAGRNIVEGDLKQDEDVMDTWFSSWIWPIQVFDGLHKEQEVDYYYPTNDIVTAPEIMFFWVARMIMSGYHYRNLPPFKNVYFTGIVRDELGRKMSKSLGNSPDPIELMEKYGADGVRVGMLLTSPAGNDLPFDEKLCETGRNFSNKIWNAFRLVKGWEIDESKEQPEHAVLAIQWMESRTNAALKDLESQYREFRLSEALMTSYRLVWEEFCSWYLELVKPVYGEPVDRKTVDATYAHFERIVKILHPFMPFLTEEVWSWLGERRTPEEALIVSQWPEAEVVKDVLLKDFDVLKEIVGGVRNIRKDNGIANREKLELKIQKAEGYPKGLDSAISHLTNLESIEEVSEKVEGAFGFMVGRHRFYIPFGDGFDIVAEKSKIQKDLDYQKGFLKSVRGKLSNENFVSGAPDSVVANERKKEADAVAKIEIMQEKLLDLG